MKLKLSICKTVGVFVILLGWLLQNSSCANMIPPSGGPKDTIPPQLVRVVPADSSRNIQPKKIVLEFNEFIELKDVEKQVIVSPTMERNPYVEYKVKTVTVRMRDSLKPNTTYSINFGKSITDYTESNPAKNLTYVFSTGSYFDSLSLRGKVIMAAGGGTDSTLTVMLHTDEVDSSVIKKRPIYYTKVERDGSFRFNYLPNQRFAVYALEDEGGSRKYFGGKQLFAFGDSMMQPGINPPVIVLYAYKEPEVQKPIKKRPDELKRLTYVAFREAKVQPLNKPLTLTFSNPLKSVDSSGLQIVDTTGKLFTAYNLQIDSAREQLYIHAKWPQDTKLKLMTKPNFAMDTLGNAIAKADTTLFSTAKKAEYGTLILRFKDSVINKNFLLQLLLNNEHYAYLPITQKVLRDELFSPGEYQLRVVEDKNGNGKWDTGEFFGKRRQPERSTNLERKLVVKPNWQNEIEIVW